MPCSHGNRTPKEQYDMMLTFAPYPNNIYMWFGRTSEEILKALKYWDEHSIHGMDSGKQEQTKMTRDEATKLVAKACGVPVGAMGGGNIVDALEALGLIKFDEPEMVAEDNKPSPSMVIRSKLIGLVNQSMQCADGIINALYKAGYTISNQKGELKLSKSIYSCGITEGNLKALNASGYEIVYTGVTTSSSTEFLTISVGTHTHTVALETIIKALNAKGCTVYRNRVEL